MHGGYVCASHGGKTPATLAAAERRQAYAEAMAEVAERAADRGPLTIADVYREMLETAGVVVAWKDVLRERVAQLSDLSTRNKLGTDQVRSEVILYERALDRSMKVLETIARLDLDSRLARLSEQQGTQIAGAMRRIFDRIDLTPEQRSKAEAVAAEELRRLGGRA